ncbi:ion transporter [Herbivorax sp. ANBcel31]|uniref:ion transporter n=1 Tax=Herbivorax sp. ANBcel31 TaxID=3069754 RepID=UPI0027AE074E|nr:ion transporter [Herbivorax sp. ANBcel31]MDQ2084930.1 ion transporter [Herbivorax sp. ANBcel31]
MFINNNFKNKLYNIIFETDTFAGKAFDIILIVTILCNSILIVAESIDVVKSSYGVFTNFLGWFFLIVFSVEYFLRIFVSKRKRDYIFSFFGIIDILAILPVYLGLFFPQAKFLVVIRIFRLLRLFSIFKMARYIHESSHLIRALKASKPKILVFLFTIIFIIVMVGAMMYTIEGPKNGFDNIPESMYWAIVTVSTVGYGDISPQTPVGKLLSSLLMITAYGIIAVPTGIISHELALTSKNVAEIKTCSKCSSNAHSNDDKYCPKCGIPYE